MANPNCLECGKTKGLTVHEQRMVYCSKNCMAEAYKTRFLGADNPHFSNASSKICGECGKEYQSYQPTSKYCSKECYTSAHLERIRAMAIPASHAPRRPREKNIPVRTCPICGEEFSKRKAKTCSRICGDVSRSNSFSNRIPSPPPQPNQTCLQCKNPFHSYNKKRLYCSYGCSLRAGTPQRAGAASVKAHMKYGAKKDANHNEIADAFAKLGIPCYDLSSMGGGVPDCLVWVWDSWQLVEIKNKQTSYGKRGLNKVQKAWVSKWLGGPVYVICSVDEAISFSKNELGGIEVVYPDYPPGRFLKFQPTKDKDLPF